MENTMLTCILQVACATNPVVRQALLSTHLVLDPATPIAELCELYGGSKTTVTREAWQVVTGVRRRRQRAAPVVPPAQFDLSLATPPVQASSTALDAQRARLIAAIKGRTESGKPFSPKQQVSEVEKAKRVLADGRYQRAVAVWAKARQCSLTAARHDIDKLWDAPPPVPNGHDAHS